MEGLRLRKPTSPIPRLKDRSAALGQDPSSPAIWLPMQSPTSSNHTAAFAQSYIDKEL